MEDSKFRQLTLEGSFIFLFLRNIQQDALPVERLSLLVANEICIFLDPDSGAIPSDQPIFFQKTGTAAITFVVYLYNFKVLPLDRSPMPAGTRRSSWWSSTRSTAAARC